MQLFQERGEGRLPEIAGDVRLAPVTVGAPTTPPDTAPPFSRSSTTGIN
jgi:hypothetical protein